MSDDSPLVRKHSGDFRWQQVDVLRYKQEGAAPFKDVTRQVLFEGKELPAQLRYFEVAPGGYTTLERHNHVHAVMVIRGKGQCLVGDKAYDVDETMSRAELEKLTAELVDRSLRVCDEVLTNCGLKPADIGEVLLVGGQSRMPLVRSKIREFFGKEPSKAVHPDEAVALGAALLADSIQTGEIGGIVLMDVLPMSIGVGMPGGRFKKIVERNTPLPHRKTHSVWTSQDQQKMLEIPIFQGDQPKAQDNEYLGTLVVADLPPGTRGNVVFDVIFSITAESLLTVTAEERGTARSVTATFSTQDTPEAVQRRLGASPPDSQASEQSEEGGKGGLLGWLKRKLE